MTAGDSKADVASHDAPGQREVPCPGCGYDLRALAGAGRCPECGLEVDSAALDVSVIPWAHRRRIGRVRGYFKTAWQFAIGSARLKFEAARPQVPADARAFARVTGAILGGLLVAVWLTAAVVSKGEMVRAMLVHAESPMEKGPPAREPWLDDVLVPYSAAAQLGWAIPLGLFLLGFHLAGAQRTVFRAAREARESQRRVMSLGWYTSAPLLLFVPAALLVGALCWIGLTTESGGSAMRSSWISTGMIILGFVAVTLLFAGVVFTALRVAQWVRRTSHCGAGRATVALAEWLGLWLVGFGLFGFVLPWCVGFFWIVIDSLR